MDKNKQKKRTALGNRLRTLRRCNGMTQREVAARLHLDRSSYAYYEIGKTEPDLHTLSEIAGIIHGLFAGQRGVYCSDTGHPVAAYTGLSCCQGTG